MAAAPAQQTRPRERGRFLPFHACRAERSIDEPVARAERCGYAGASAQAVGRSDETTALRDGHRSPGLDRGISTLSPELSSCSARYGQA